MPASARLSTERERTRSPACPIDGIVDGGTAQRRGLLLLGLPFSDRLFDQCRHVLRQPLMDHGPQHRADHRRRDVHRHPRLGHRFRRGPGSRARSASDHRARPPHLARAGLRSGGLAGLRRQARRRAGSRRRPVRRGDRRLRPHRRRPRGDDRDGGAVRARGLSRARRIRRRSQAGDHVVRLRRRRPARSIEPAVLLPGDRQPPCRHATGLRDDHGTSGRSRPIMGSTIRSPAGSDRAIACSAPSARSPTPFQS